MAHSETLLAGFSRVPLKALAPETTEAKLNALIKVAVKARAATRIEPGEHSWNALRWAIMEAEDAGAFGGNDDTDE